MAHCSGSGDFSAVTKHESNPKSLVHRHASHDSTPHLRLPKLHPPKRLPPPATSGVAVTRKQSARPQATVVGLGSKAENDSAGDTVTVNLDYLSPSMFLEVANTKFGPTTAFQSLGLRSVSHENGFLEPRDDGTVEIVFEEGDESLVEMCATMELYRKDYKENCDRFILKSRQGPRSRFAICFPESGVFILKIFAHNPVGTTCAGLGQEKIGIISGNPTNVLNYLVSVRSSSRNCFPRVFPHWNSINCVLIEPLFDYLPSHSSVKFVLKVSNASQVYIESEGEELEPLGKDFGDFWRGSVKTGAFGSQLNVCAKFGDDLELVGPLLRYTVVKSTLDYTYDNMIKLEHEILRRETEKLSHFRKKLLEQVSSSEGVETPAQVHAEEPRIMECLKREKKRLCKLGKSLKPHQLKERRKVEERKLVDLVTTEERRLVALSHSLESNLAEVRKRNEQTIEKLEGELKTRLTGISSDLDDILLETGWTKKQMSKRREAQRHLIDELHTLHCQMAADVRRSSERHLAEVASAHARTIDDLRQRHLRMISILRQRLEKLFPVVVGRASQAAPPSHCHPSAELPANKVKQRMRNDVGRLERKLRTLGLTRPAKETNDNETC